MDLNFKNIIKFWLVIIGILVIFPVAGSLAKESSKNTLLLFVGEDQDILSIASGREESAWQAPAVALVLDREDFRQKHYQTLSEAIDSIPGFHVVETASGVHSYLRGIPESVLYLYDTVPMQFADEIPLHSIKRIEIVRGPGSVLWGSDAFAGIVNAVPMTGKDLDGTETGMIFSSKDNRKGAYVNKGWDRDIWDAFLSVSGSHTEKEDFNSDITRFWGTSDEPVPVDERRGRSAGESGQYMEIVGNFSFKDVFKISGRFSDSKIPYSLSYLDKSITWKEVRNERIGFLKIEGKKRFGIDSAIRFTGTISMLDSKKQVIDKKLDHNELETYGEMTYEKVFNSGNSHLTAGISFRDADKKGVSIWDSFLPDYLVDENDAFLPSYEQNDYTTKLWSVFAQYHMSMGDFDLILGLRNDEHDSFDDNISYNTGVVWKPSESWVCKALLGTAYRTPSAKQLFQSRESELEEIKNLSLEVSKKFGKKAEMSVYGFINKIENHILMDDPYAGLSIPNSQKINGFEFAFLYAPTQSVIMSVGLTFLKNNGPDESYLYNDYSTILPDGTIEKHYVLLEYPYDTGPDRFGNIDVVWQAAKDVEVFGQAKYFSGYRLIYPHADEYKENDSTWTLDVGIRFKNLILEASDFEIQFKNILDVSYMIPGRYSFEQGAPFSINILWRKRF